MTRLQGTQAEGNVSYIAPYANFDDAGSTTFGGGASTGSDGGDAVENAFVPALYAMYSVSPDLKLGLGINTPYGLMTEYDDDWLGRYHAIKSELKTINVQPTVAYRLSDQVSIGAGVNIQYAAADLSSAVDFTTIAGTVAGAGVATSGLNGDGLSRVEGDDIAFGGTVGVLFEPTETTRVGVSYRSRVHHTLEGDVEFQNAPTFSGGAPGLADALNARFANGKAKASLVTPDSANLGVYHEINDQWAVMGEVTWTNWSLFKSLSVNRTSGENVSFKEENWEDSWFFSLGATYKPTPQWELGLGVAYDQTPVKEEFRTPRVPDQSRTWLAFGVGYNWSDAVRLNAGYTHIWVDEADINDTTTMDLGLATLSDTLRGSYDANIDIVSVGATIRF